MAKAGTHHVNVVLNDDVARWARDEAAARDTSVARLLAQLLKEKMRDFAEAAMERFLSRRPFERHEADPYSARAERR